MVRTWPTRESSPCPTGGRCRAEPCPRRRTDLVYGSRLTTQGSGDRADRRGAPGRDLLRARGAVARLPRSGHSEEGRRHAESRRARAARRGWTPGSFGHLAAGAEPEVPRGRLSRQSDERTVPRLRLRPQGWTAVPTLGRGTRQGTV